jgi:hypothetical protein
MVYPARDGSVITGAQFFFTVLMNDPALFTDMVVLPNRDGIVPWAFPASIYEYDYRHPRDQPAYPTWWEQHALDPAGQP